MKRPQIGSKYLCIQDEYRGFTKGQTYIVTGFDADNDIIFENSSGMGVFFNWREECRGTSMFISDFFKPCEIYLGGE